MLAALADGKFPPGPNTAPFVVKLCLKNRRSREATPLPWKIAAFARTAIASAFWDLTGAVLFAAKADISAFELIPPAQFRLSGTHSK